MSQTAGTWTTLLILGGCATLAPAPLHYDSYCKSGTAPDIAALRQVAASLEDGTHYKSPSGPFTARPKRYLENYGGVVGTWDPRDFYLPRTIAEARKLGFEPFALAVPDDGPYNGSHRIVFLAFRSVKHTTLVTWTPQASSDRENTCK